MRGREKKRESAAVDAKHQVCVSVSLCLCVCACVCVCVCESVCLCVCIYLCMHIYMHTYTHIQMHMRTRACGCRYVCKNTSLKQLNMRLSCFVNKSKSNVRRVCLPVGLCVCDFCLIDVAFILL